MAVLEREIARYESMRAELEKNHNGEWVLIHQEEMVGTYNSFEDAGRAAVRRFGRGPYLIRKVGAPPLTLPASVQFRYINAND